jgi:hypothetical protein
MSFGDPSVGARTRRDSPEISEGCFGLHGSGGPLWMGGHRQSGGIFMTDQATPPAAAPAPAPKPRWARWVSWFVGVVVVLTVGIKLLAAFTLAPCGENHIEQAVREIFKERSGLTVSVADASEVSSDDQSRSCTARITVTEGGAGETGTVTYRVFWDGWSEMVQIGEVNVDTAPAAAPTSG